MQQTPIKRNEKMRMGVKGFFWTAGLLMAGSDGNYMPWVNGMGLLVFAASSILLARQSLGMASTPETKEYPGFDEKSASGKKQVYPFVLPVTGL
nr:hypothetical protein [Desulfobacula sp.]